jgi:hypothetical protein
MKQVKSFLEAPANTASVTTAVAVAGTSRTRVYELRKKDNAFAAAWDEAEDMPTGLKTKHVAAR